MRFRLITVVAAACLASAMFAGPKNVDCNKGQSINKALESNDTDLTIEFSGICQEDVLIVRDRVTLKGVGSATIVGAPGVLFADRKPALKVRGASNVVLVNFDVDDSDHRGIELYGASVVTIDNVDVTDSRTGLLLLGQSSAFVKNCDFNENVGDGIGVWDNSSLTLEGTNNLNDNTRVGLIVSGGSSVSLGPLGATTNSNNNNFGFWLQLGAQAQMQSGGGATTNALGNAVIGLEVSSESHWAGGPTTVSGSDYGVSAEMSGSIAGGPYNVSSCYTAFYVAENSNLDAPNVHPTGNDIGMDVIASQVRTNNSTFTGNNEYDVGLWFGSQLTAFGSSATVVYCDDNVITRGGIQCPPSLMAAKPKSGGLSTKSARPAREFAVLPLE